MKKILLFILVITSFWAEANLVIHPIRVQFNPEDRSAEITLLNDSNKTNTYRLEWREKKAKVGGGYIDLKGDELKNFPVASPMVRYTPRQVTLKPGERQTVKMTIRRNARLPEGEYRSHLIFKALPPPGLLAAPDEQTAGLTMKLNMVTSFVIPVVVQQGKFDAQIRLDKAVINYNPAEPNKSTVRLDISRQGKHSVFGDLEAYWTPAGGKEVLLGKIASFSSWPELPTTFITLGWVGSDFALTDGKLRVVYKGMRDFKDRNFFDTSVQINRSDIKIMN
jgi:fimbrial chaperone protein